MAYLPRLIFTMILEAVEALEPHHRPHVAALLDALVTLSTFFKSVESLSSAPPVLTPSKWMKLSKQYAELLGLKPAEILAFAGHNPKLFKPNEYQASTSLAPSTDLCTSLAPSTDFLRVPPSWPACTLPGPIVSKPRTLNWFNL